MRITLAVAVACLSLGGLAAAGDATAAIRKDTHIPAEGLGPALTKLAKEFDFQVLYRTEVVGKLHTEGAVGALTSEEALGRVLSGTGLTYKYLDDKTVTIIPLSTADSGQSPYANASASSNDGSTSKEVGKKTSRDFRVAQVDQGKNSNASSIAAQNSNSVENPSSPSTGLSEIVVTAQKREQRLLDVPVPVTVVSAESLTDNNQLRLQDYYTQIPGLALVPGSRGEVFLSIRGITSGSYTAPTVGVTVDDVPFGTSNQPISMPDIDPSDLSRVEILRGPQGTLYGASSIGGLIKYVTIDPSPTEVSGRLEAGVSSVYNGNRPGYNARGAINVPLNDTLAVRLSGYTREDPGYIDNPFRGIDGVNEDHAYGGRLSALWRPSEIFSIKLAALIQHTDADGNPNAQVGSGFADLQQNFLSGSGKYSKDAQVYNATVKAKLGSVDLISISGYNYARETGNTDETVGLGSTFMPLFGVSGAEYFESLPVKTVTEELRLSSSLGAHIDWLVGAFYSHEHYVGSANFPAVNPVTGVTVGNWGSLTLPATYEETAVFADLTYHVTDRFDIQMGGRESFDRESNDGSVYTGDFALLFGSNPYRQAPASGTARPITYLITPQFKISPDLMLYARVASGFRPGGPNSAPAALEGLPPLFAPDKTKNYEVGLKADALDNALTFDVSVYRIDWTGIQLLVQSGCCGGYTANAGQAKSQGLELETQARPLKGLTIGAWITWADAELTKGLPANSGLAGAPGDVLPYSTRFSGNLSVQQDFPLAGHWSGFLGGMLSYIGKREGDFTQGSSADFTSGGGRLFMPTYAKTDLRAGAKYGTWMINLSANNVTDRRGVIGGGAPNSPGQLVYIQPRTVGLSVSKSF